MSNNPPLPPRTHVPRISFEEPESKKDTTAATASSPSTPKSSGIKYLPMEAQHLKELEGLTIFTSEEIEQLYKRFAKLDTNMSGTIDRNEFQAIPQLASNPLGQRLIDIFDEDGGGDVDFKEFIHGLSIFSGKCSKEEKIRFAFKIYDMDRDGYISNGELYMVMKNMVGNNLTPVQLQQIVDKTIMEADRDGDGRISFEEFSAFVAKTDIVKQLTLEAL
ncbi:Calcineurin subunit B [Mycoemilia scoparia]|uniref:Calcineurin subunit B n=1 Tax=Mycoemilia scoparia TaxID=417184 RepID=A0A9W8ABP0_9FUNG|nr:Calcineurin subunit B [Mycoemilia scoparia]